VPNTDDETPDEPIEPAAAAAPVAPSFVPSDEFKTFQSLILGRFDEMAQGLAAMRVGAAPQAHAPAAPAVERVTEQQFEDAVAGGDGKVVRAYIRQEREDLKREHIDPLSTTGLESLAGLTREVVFKNMPRYEKYKKEIDASLATLPAATRLNPEVLKVMYDAVVGRHADECRRAISRAPSKTSQATRASRPLASWAGAARTRTTSRARSATTTGKII
jgi:hypothetical protein